MTRTAIVTVALFLSAAWLANASWLAGTKFPFENCVQNTTRSPYYSTLLSYDENIKSRTSRFCIQIHVKPWCDPGRFRCCDTHINKVKFFPAPDCRGSIPSVTVSNPKLGVQQTVTSVYWEEHEGFDIVKITPLREFLPDPQTADGAVLCFNLRMPCWSLPQLSYDKEVLEYSLYDKKTDNYECCPVGLYDVPLPPMPPFAPELDYDPSPRNEEGEHGSSPSLPLPSPSPPPPKHSPPPPRRMPPPPRASPPPTTKRVRPNRKAPKPPKAPKSPKPPKPTRSRGA
ncbi:hypothetical protein HYH03_007572 [Edaphochlamys debaryana]|uniref:Pherophorin domain-containing protein n=1 Tax=Edaphochlamys debaryana TaxID=47281 RepID=A0A836BYU8_9CHLO|nr:hypothetical protein HYH03_007572 [Edaphochlamys debaryana]|eukprot:KAG2494216.1 hypothetical protein HYH03_007572 [Edaphochlamys debaryana]